MVLRYNKSNKRIIVCPVNLEKLKISIDFKFDKEKANIRKNI